MAPGPVLCYVARALMSNSRLAKSSALLALANRSFCFGLSMCQLFFHHMPSWDCPGLCRLATLPAVI